MPPLVVGISGQISAGKTTAGEYLERFGFGYTRISWVIGRLIREAGEEESRDNFQRWGRNLHQSPGQEWLCEESLKHLKGNRSRFVVDGLRWTADVHFFRGRYGDRFIHVHIEAPKQTRRERFEARNPGVPFNEVDNDPVESGVPAAGALADITITNDRDVNLFQARLRAQVLEGLNAG